MKIVPRFVPNVVCRQDDDDNNDVTKLEHRSSDAAAATSAMNVFTNRIFLFSFLETNTI